MMNSSQWLRAIGSTTWLSVCGALLMSTGCGDDDGDPAASGGAKATAGASNLGGETNQGGSSGTSGGSDGEAGTGGSDGEAGAGGATGDGPGLYFAEEFVETGDVQTAYLDTKQASSADELSDFDPAADGIELAGAGVATPRESAIYAPDGLAPEITRYEIGTDGKLTKGATLSFSGAGLTAVDGYDIAVVSETKGYVFDNAGVRAVAWNPSEMVLTGEEIDLSPVLKEGYTAQARAFFARAVDGRLFVPIVWRDVDNATLRTSAALIIDTETDEIVTLAEDDRCPGISIVPLPSGDLHFFVPSGWAQEFYLNVSAPRDPLCSLRIQAGEDSFDPDYELNLTELVGGDENGGGGVQGGIPDGEGGVYIAVADEERYADPEAYDFLVYKLWHLDLATETASEVEDAPWWGGAMTRHYLFNDYAYAVQPFGETGTTTVFEMKKSLRWFEMSGWIEPFVRVR